MPKSREEIYNMLSPNILKRKKRRSAMAVKVSKEIPPAIDNAIVCDSEIAHSLNIEPVLPEPIHISPNEGKPAVNGQAEKVDIRPMKQEIAPDVGAAAIPMQVKKKPGRPKKDKKDTDK